MRRMDWQWAQEKVTQSDNVWWNGWGWTAGKSTRLKLCCYVTAEELRPGEQPTQQLQCQKCQTKLGNSMVWITSSCSQHQSQSTMDGGYGRWIELSPYEIFSAPFHWAKCLRNWLLRVACQSSNSSLLIFKYAQLMPKPHSHRNVDAKASEILLLGKIGTRPLRRTLKISPTKYHTLHLYPSKQGIFHL